ncbi:hypothetical protein CLF_110235 [Clonorchis sinensis]|uniref:Gap-Pol polyprotein n=1 Tax=Clonorchis sinensis TaxID=79923 RepID=G7YTB3_CLOSI|nr:hypothetical protein CLF_110235 [Clonorchis sinensis]
MVLLVIRASIQPTTGKSPFMLMYGRRPCLPVDQEIGLWPITRLPPAELDEERGKARENLTTIQKRTRQKTASRKARSFPIGAKVKWKDHQKPGRSGLGSRKLGSRWQGPFVVIDRRGNVYTIQDSRGSKRVNGTQLRKWHDTPEERPIRPAAEDDLTKVNEQPWHADDLLKGEDSTRYNSSDVFSVGSLKTYFYRIPHHNVISSVFTNWLLNGRCVKDKNMDYPWFS